MTNTALACALHAILLWPAITDRQRFSIAWLPFPSRGNARLDTYTHSMTAATMNAAFIPLGHDPSTIQSSALYANFRGLLKLGHPLVRRTKQRYFRNHWILMSYSRNVQAPLATWVYLSPFSETCRFWESRVTNQEYYILWNNRGKPHVQTVCPITLPLLKKENLTLGRFSFFKRGSVIGHTVWTCGFPLLFHSI